MYFHFHHCWPDNVMDIIWTASAVEGIQFEVLNSVLIRQDTRAAGVAIKMQMRPLMHLLFQHQILLQMFAQIELMYFVKDHMGPQMHQEKYEDCPKHNTH